MSLLQKSLLVTLPALPSLSTPAAGGFGQPAEGVTHIGDGVGWEETAVSRAGNSGSHQPAPGGSQAPELTRRVSSSTSQKAVRTNLGQLVHKELIISNTSYSPQHRAYFGELVSFPSWLRTEETLKCPPEPSVRK